MNDLNPILYTIRPGDTLYNLADLEPTKARLLKNPKDIADVFRKYYGNNVASTIEKLLTEHLVIGGDIIVALKNGNQKLADELNKKWYKNADDMAVAFKSILSKRSC